LVYTCDERIVPTLIELMYSQGSGNGKFWATEGLLYYVPREGRVKEELLEAARELGLSGGMQRVLEEYGSDEEVFGEVIGKSLESDDADVVRAGAAAAQEYPDDRQMGRLIELAMDANSPAREQAIFALACHRTDEGVKALKVLLKDKDKRVRRTTGDAIRSQAGRASG